ncbi:MAG: CehA/McbA family metallohydrolase [Brachybacterium sp.]|uniref:CehA/McbA family metallohydrolase n=1 Tax=Brachybacterium sp. TaxID=1891286 RepID=UPI002648D50B|nr:CehA/McbA family metallohydrolase [Brachybacterium sp.]MDN5685915.1 CehA/McbA family metallohydrolase [Brachybacterium sp.]
MSNAEGFPDAPGQRRIGEVCRAGPAPEVLNRIMERELTLAVQAQDRYVRIPFDVPRNLRSLEVDLEVLDQGAVIDLGCEGAAGWRGWSGGAHRCFTISTEDASPGYLPGPLEEGRWHVVLGLHSLDPGRTRVRVTVRGPARTMPDHGPHPEPARRRVRGRDRLLPAPSGMRWLAGDTHAHSVHSDGALSLDELADEAVRSGLDFLCVTDHNTTSHHRFLPETGRRHGITLLPGQEITTHRGHANAYGAIDFVDFRRPVEEWASSVITQGGLLSINHPVSGDCSWLHAVPSGVTGVEIMHSDAYRSPISTAPFAWFSLLQAQRSSGGNAVAGGRTRDTPMALFAGGDFHHSGDRIRPGTPTTWVCAEDDSVDAILAAMTAGRTALTTSVAEGTSCSEDHEMRPDLFEAPMVLRTDPDTVHVLNAAGFVLVDLTGAREFIEDSEGTLPAPYGRGPYVLESPERSSVAMCQ